MIRDVLAGKKEMAKDQKGRERKLCWHSGVCVISPFHLWEMNLDLLSQLFRASSPLRTLKPRPGSPTAPAPWTLPAPSGPSSTRQRTGSTTRIAPGRRPPSPTRYGIRMFILATYSAVVFLIPEASFIKPL